MTRRDPNVVWSGWTRREFDNLMASLECPRCGAAPWARCKKANGMESKRNHNERATAAMIRLHTASDQGGGAR